MQFVRPQLFSHEVLAALERLERKILLVPSQPHRLAVCLRTQYPEEFGPLSKADDELQLRRPQSNCRKFTLMNFAGYLPTLLFLFF